MSIARENWNGKLNVRRWSAIHVRNMSASLFGRLMWVGGRTVVVFGEGRGGEGRGFRQPSGPHGLEWRIATEANSNNWYIVSTSAECNQHYGGESIERKPVLRTLHCEWLLYTPRSERGFCYVLSSGCVSFTPETCQRIVHAHHVSLTFLLEIHDNVTNVPKAHVTTDEITAQKHTKQPTPITEPKENV